MSEHGAVIREPTPDPGRSAHAADEAEREVVRPRRLGELEQRQAARHRGRALSTVILAVLTVLALVATTVAAWVRSTALQSDRFMEVVEPVLGTPEVAAALRTRLTADVVGALDIEARLEARLSDLGFVISGALADALELGPEQREQIEALPLPQLQSLAAPIASGLEARIATYIDQFVAAREFQRLLVEGAEAAHTKAVALLRGEYEQLSKVEVEAGEVRLNLVPVVARVLEGLVDQGLGAIGIQGIPFIDPVEDPEASLRLLATALEADLPADFGQLTVMSEAELSQLQASVRLADQLVWILALLTAVLFTATMAAARRRRRVLTQLALFTAAATVMTMALVRGTEDDIASTAVTAQGREALALLAGSIFDSLRSVMIFVLLVALVAAAAAHLLGRPPWRRRSIARSGSCSDL